MLREAGGANPREACRRILAQTMSPHLLAKFTYSGLGEGRKRTKESFAALPLCPMIEGQLLTSGDLKCIYLSVITAI